MRKITISVFVILFAWSCSTRKQVEKALNTGNYNEAIYNAIDKLSNNKDAKRNQDLIILLKDAYNKANERDLESIRGLKASNNPEFYKRIYETYIAMNERQKAIKPLLPLTVNGQDVKFKFKDYTSNIVSYKDKVSDYFYEKGIQLLESDDKQTIRDAYSTLEYIENINPNYENTRELLDEAHERGIAHVIVSIENQTNQVIPRPLEDALLDFNTYGLNQFWTSYHSNTNQQQDFDYSMQLQLQQILISPEQVKEREILRERRIKDGWEYQLDRSGNVMKDSLGNDIKIDKFVNAKANVLEFQQFKSSQILGEVLYTEIQTNQIFQRFPIDSGFIFENIYATFTGNRKALTDEDLTLTRGEPIPFPPNEQMIFDTGEDLKNQLKQIILRVRF